MKFTEQIKRKYKGIAAAIKKLNPSTLMSFFICGFANITRGQAVKGTIFLFIQAAYIIYMIMSGGAAIAGLATLGTRQQDWVFDETLGIDILLPGDNSMLILLFGILGVVLSIAFLLFYIMTIKSAYKLKNSNKKPLNFMQELLELKDDRLHITMMFLPCLFILIFIVLPLIFMISIGFTNFDNAHQPPGNLFTWTGLKNFETLFSGSGILGRTFWPILLWTFTWALIATVSNYFLGMMLAMFINKKNIKLKSFWRTIFMLTIAIPQFVSLLVIRVMLDEIGPINELLVQWGIVESAVPFLSTYARITVLTVNLWIGIPYTMLITTGILMNIPEDLYESAKIDGANGFRMYINITLPFVFFVTSPYVITQFIGNINNFNIIYLLTGGGPMDLSYYQAGRTDLLVTWLYRLTVDRRDYSIASAIGIIVFVISAVFSIIAYRQTGAFKKEEEFA